MAVLRISPALLVALGLVLIVGGFVYDTILAGIPYQDSTSAMSAGYQFHSRVASALRSGGMFLLPAGLIWGLTRRLGRKGPDDAKGSWNWRRALVALLFADVACSLVTVLVFTTASVCPGTRSLGPSVELLLLPALPAMGFFVTALIALSLFRNSIVFGFLASAAVIGFAVAFVMAAIAALRPTKEGGWAVGPIMRFLLLLAGLSALSTIRLCFSLTA